MFDGFNRVFVHQIECIRKCKSSMTLQNRNWKLLAAECDSQIAVDVFQWNLNSKSIQLTRASVIWFKLANSTIGLFIHWKNSQQINWEMLAFGWNETFDPVGSNERSYLYNNKTMQKQMAHRGWWWSAETISFVRFDFAEQFIGNLSKWTEN